MCGPPTPSQLGRDPVAPEGPRLQPRLAVRSRRGHSKDARHPLARPRARRGRGATPGRRHPVLGASACAYAEGPDRESRAGSRSLPTQGEGGQTWGG